MNHKEQLALDKFLSKDMTEATVFPTTLSMQDVIDMAPVKLEVTRGNQDINELVSFFQERRGKTLDGTIQDNRRYCYNLIRKIKKDYPDKDPIKAIKVLIDLALADDFHSINATSFKYIYYNTQKIITLYQKKSKKETAHQRLIKRQLEDAEKYQRNTLVATNWLSFCERWLDRRFGPGNWSMKQKFANLQRIKADYDLQ